MMGRQTADQARLFYEFHLDERVPAGHLLRRIDVFTAAALADLRQKLADHYSHTGRPSIDPELPVVTSCGSGVTASILSLALAVLGQTNAAVYDGSWAEWGAENGLPIETGPAP